MKSGVPIKKVRMIQKGKTFRKFEGSRSYQSVKPGNNHHVSYFEEADPKGGIKWTTDVTTMWDAAQRGRKGQPIVDRSNRGDKRFLFSLCIGEAFEIVDEQGEVHLCIVRKINFNGMIYFKTHDDARPAGELDKSNLYYSAKNMCSLQAQKVRIDRLGRVHHVTN
jgi:CRISPR-associated endonuclease Csn1